MRLLPVLLLALLVAGCSTPPERDAATTARAEPLALAVRVLADTGRAGPLAVRPPGPRDTLPARSARAWLAEVAPAREALPPAPLPEPGPDPAATPAPPAPGRDPDLLPPVLRNPAVLVLRAPRGTRAASVELDVRVDEQGVVSDALWAGGTRDTALVNAAIACALGMRFWPARQDDVPVAVWCRQRFDFSR